MAQNNNNASGNNMFRKSMHQQGKHTHPQTHGKDKPDMLAQARKQRPQDKAPKAETKYYSTVRPYQQSYKPLGSVIEIILRFHSFLHVIRTQNAAALHNKHREHSSSNNRSVNYFRK